MEADTPGYPSPPPFSYIPSQSLDTLSSSMPRLYKTVFISYRLNHAQRIRNQKVGSQSEEALARHRGHGAEFISDLNTIAQSSHECYY